MRLVKNAHLLISIIFCLVILFFSPDVSSEEFVPKGPLTMRNQNPLYLQFLNIEPTRAVTIPKNSVSFRVDNEYSNTFERGLGRNTELFIDMESLRTSFNIDVGVYDNMEAGIEIPFLRFDTGFLDGFIQGYHNTFGFPNGGRERAANGSFDYRFLQGGNAIYNVGMEDFGLGDITLKFKHNFWEEKKLAPAVAWLFYFKLPTGSPKDGTGSGEPDFGFGTAFEKSYERWHGYLNLAYFVNGGQSALQNYIYSIYFSFMTGIELSINKTESAVLQLTGGSPLLKGTGMKQMDWVPLDLQAGFKGEHKTESISQKPVYLTWQAGFSEDINPNGPSIDLTAFGSIGVRY
ncbi:MAG: DUF3187 family protein [Deltaproteobacteria bacterium]|nr:DUF3187 family protein [Deltaproteobacteria bacterium]